MSNGSKSKIIASKCMGNNLYLRATYRSCSTYHKLCRINLNLFIINLNPLKTETNKISFVNFEIDALFPSYNYSFKFLCHKACWKAFGISWELGSVKQACLLPSQVLRLDRSYYETRDSEMWIYIKHFRNIIKVKTKPYEI